MQGELAFHLLYIVRPISPQHRKEFVSCFDSGRPLHSGLIAEVILVECQPAADLVVCHLAMAKADLEVAVRSYISKGFRMKDLLRKDILSKECQA